METISGSGNLSNIKTAVFYKWNKYLPENAASMTQCHNIFLKDYSSTDVFYLSEDSETDYLGFSEYDFKIKPEKEKYHSFIKTNYFDTFTKENFIKNDAGDYDETGLRWLTEVMFPQYSEEPGKIEKKFFGMISKGSQGIVYIDIPGEERDELDPDVIIKNGIWKVEFYPEILETNNSLGEKKFIEYSVLKECGLEGIEPAMTIVFGPPSKANQNPLQMYYNSLELKGEIPEYPKEEKENIKGWINLCREISSRKILYLIISSTGELSSINLSYLSWELSKNPNRNQDQYSLRNDYFWASRDTTSPVLMKKSDSSDSSAYIYDSTSGVLLATKALYEGSTPTLDRKIDKVRDKFLSRKVYSEADIVPLNDNLYVSLISGNLGENPMYSKYWLKLKDYDPGDESKYLTVSRDEKLKILRNKLTPRYTNFYVHTNNKSISDIEPSGDLSYRVGINKEITIKPTPGYEVYSIYKNGESQEPQYDKSRSLYTYMMSSTDDTVGTTQDIYIEVIKSALHITLVSPLKIWSSDKKQSELKEFNDLSSLESEWNILTSLYFIEGDGQFPITSQDSTNSRRYDLPVRYENQEVYLGFDYENSPYECHSIKIKSDLLDEFVECEEIKEDIFKSRFKLFPVESENSKDYLSREVSIELTTKKLTVSVIGDNNTDISTVGDYIDYGGSFSFNFTSSSDLSDFFPRVIWQFDGDSESQEIDRIGDYENLSAGLVNNKGIYTFSLSNIRKNCEIKITGV